VDVSRELVSKSKPVSGENQYDQTLSQWTEELPRIVCEQLWLLHRRKVSAPGHHRPSRNVRAAFRQRPCGMAISLGKTATATSSSDSVAARQTEHRRILNPFGLQFCAPSCFPSLCCLMCESSPTAEKIILWPRTPGPAEPPGHPPRLIPNLLPHIESHMSVKITHSERYPCVIPQT
jgi:hypothetical protein